MRNTVFLAVLFIGMSGCVKQRAVRSDLAEAGVRGPVADCMSAEMANRLSVAELQKLADARARPGETAQPVTLADYAERARRVGDARVIAVTAGAAAYCSASR